MNSLGRKAGYADPAGASKSHRSQVICPWAGDGRGDTIFGIELAEALILSAFLASCNRRRDWFDLRLQR